MKKYTPIEIIFLVVASIFLILSLDKSSEYYHFYRAAFYFFTGLSITSKSIRTFKILTQTSKLFCFLGNGVVYFAAFGTLIFSTSNFNLLWLLGVLVFSTRGQKTIEKDNVLNP